MQIKIDLPETLALQLIHGEYSPTEIIEQGLHWLGIEADASNQPNMPVPPHPPRSNLSDLSSAMVLESAAPAPDVIEFLDDLSIRRSQLLNKLTPPSENR